ncbi:MAG: hypothetical protein PHH37_01470 [Paludibacter sp.]|nr:hypothetical protein [Paludibacter sp.]
MDIYSFIYDQSGWNLLFTLVTLFGIMYILSLVSKNLFDKKWVIVLYTIIYFGIRISIVQSVNTHINKLFIQCEIHSVVTTQTEWRRGAYRCKLKNGLTYFASSNAKTLDQIGDSIVKEANADSFYVYRKDPQSGVYYLVTHRKY